MVLQIVDDGLRGSSLHAIPTFEIVWKHTTGEGVPGGPTIDAVNGDVLTAGVTLSSGPNGLDAYDVSVLFDELFDDELDRIMENVMRAIDRVPAAAEAGVKRVINGPMIWSPDSNALFGPVPELRNYFLSLIHI